jgi:hypothetical protein
VEKRVERSAYLCWKVERSIVPEKLVDYIVFYFCLDFCYFYFYFLPLVENGVAGIQFNRIGLRNNPILIPTEATLKIMLKYPNLNKIIQIHTNPASTSLTPLN